MEKEWKQYTALRHLDNLETLRAMFFNHAFGRHYHEGYALGVILEGCEAWDCNNKTHVAPKGSVVAVNPGEIHNGYAANRDRGWKYFMIYPRPSLVRKALERLELDPHRLPVFPASVIQDPDLAGGLMSFMESGTAGDDKLAMESGFLELLNLLISRHAEFRQTPGVSRAGSQKISQVKDLIQARFAESLSLEGLSGTVNLSAWSLLRRFKKETGISPYLFQTALRIRAAKKALASGTSPADTAALCGFSDQSHMTKQFRRWMGITPGDVPAA